MVCHLNFKQQASYYSLSLYYLHFFQTYWTRHCLHLLHSPLFNVSPQSVLWLGLNAHLLRHFRSLTNNNLVYFLSFLNLILLPFTSLCKGAAHTVVDCSQFSKSPSSADVKFLSTLLDTDEDTWVFPQNAHIIWNNGLWVKKNDSSP